MPDITLCNGNKCDLLRAECYRFKAVPNEKQSYFDESPVKNDECEFFMPNTSQSMANVQQMRENISKEK